MDDSRHGPAQVSTQTAADAVRAPIAADATALNASDDAQSIIDGVLNEVDAMNAIAEQATKPQEANVASNDFSELEKQIQMLLSGQSAGEPQAAAVAEAVAEAAPPAPAKAIDVAQDAIEQPSHDPLIQEIDAALADDADSLLKSSGGDIDGALRSVFDERALSGQEEEINRALIEAFGTSRIERPSFAINGNVTNPLSDFDGPSREVSPEIPRNDKDRTPPMAEAPQPAPVIAAVAAAAVVAAASAPIATEVATSTAPTAKTVEPTKEPVRLDSPVVGAPTKPAATPVAHATTSAAPETPRTSMLDIVVRIVSIPAQILAAPMNALPGMGKTIVGLLAVTLVLWTPVAWWLAIRATQTPVVGPIVVKPAPKVEEKPAESHDSGGGGGGGHAAPAAASHGSPAPAAASHGGGEHH